LWNNQPEDAPLIQLQQKIRSVEEKVQSLLGEKNFNRIQIREIYSELQKMKNYFEHELMGRYSWAQLDPHCDRIPQSIHTAFDNLGNICSKNETISTAQIEKLKAAVQKKAKGERKKMAQVWSKFKKYFEIKQYKNLPQSRFYEALEWMERK
jgi:TolA-binding protein